MEQLLAGLDDGALRLVSPEDAGEEGVDPGSEGAGVRATGEDPGRLVGLAGALWVKGKLDVLGEVDEVLGGVVDGELLQVGGGLEFVGRAVAVVAMLEVDDGAADVLAQHTGHGEIRDKNLLEAIDGRLAGRGEHHRRAGLVPLGAPRVALGKGTQRRVVVINELLEEVDA